MSLSYCKHCGAEIRKAVYGITGNLMEVEPHFCRLCGHPLLPTGSLEDEDSTDELDELPDWDDLGSFNTLQEVIEAAIPENFEELSIEQLRKHIVQFLWKRFTGIDLQI